MCQRHFQAQTGRYLNVCLNEYLYDQKTGKANLLYLKLAIGDLLDLDYLEEHTMRKTGAYRVYI